jgi:hypothetical protein
VQLRLLQDLTVLLLLLQELTRQQLLRPMELYPLVAQEVQLEQVRFLHLLPPTPVSPDQPILDFLTQPATVTTGQVQGTGAGVGTDTTTTLPSGSTTGTLTGTGTTTDLGTGSSMGAGAATGTCVPPVPVDVPSGGSTGGGTVYYGYWR